MFWNIFLSSAGLIFGVLIVGTIIAKLLSKNNRIS